MLTLPHTHPQLPLMLRLLNLPAMRIRLLHHPNKPMLFMQLEIPRMLFMLALHLPVMLIRLPPRQRNKRLQIMHRLHARVFILLEPVILPQLRKRLFS